MKRVSFNDGWQVRPKVFAFAELAGSAPAFRPVALPHDAMIGQERRAPDLPGALTNSAGAYFPGGVYEYRKIFAVPEALRGKRVFIEFEGVYRDAVVYVNGVFAGQRPYGYSHFHVDVGRFLEVGRDNEIRVEARTHDDSRWYTGGGIYRDTWLMTGELVRIGLDGVRVTTPDIDAGRAVVEVAALLENDSVMMRTVDVIATVYDAAGKLVASDTSRATILPGEPALVRRRLYLRTPSLWSVESPSLYELGVTVKEDEAVLDDERTRFGIRSLQLDPDSGLRINGATVKLRGACIHHDNGVLGAATFARAEERRVEILKAAGFNAIRMSHQPMSKAMLDACDRLGMLVLDEAFDIWTFGKTGFDYSLSFPEWWERDIEAMVAKNFNHPSVIMYSIGNEIPEVGTGGGAAWGRRLAEKVRSLDSTRYVTNAVNNVLAVAKDLLAAKAQHAPDTGESTGINTLMTQMAERMNAVNSSDLVSRRTAESYGVLDVAGMNYAECRYGTDAQLFPGRIILGTETFPVRIDGNWQLVKEHGHVIGDFTWTGWDYLGEVGIGRPLYGAPDGTGGSIMAAYPYLLAGCGDIDIAGHRRSASYYREIVFGLRTQPWIAVLRPEHHGLPSIGGPWAWSDTVASWTWPDSSGAPIAVDVYSDADEIELLVNERSLGRRPVGPGQRFQARFDTVFEAGEVTAIAYRAGVETGRSSLRSATGPVVLRAEVDRPVITTATGELAFVTLSLTDHDGVLYTGMDRRVSVEVSGDGVLQGLGSADPLSAERFDASGHQTYGGRALAVLRPTGPGEIHLRASAAGCADARLTVIVQEGCHQGDRQ